MRSRMIACSAGIATIVLLPVLPPVQLLWLALAIPFLYRRFAWLSALLLGACWALGWAHWQLDQRLSLEGRSDWQVEGVVIGEPLHETGYSRFELAIDAARLLPSQTHLETPDKPRTLRLSWYRPTQLVSAGDRIAAEVRLKPPHGLVNPAGFDYERWLLQANIDATGYLRKLYQWQPGEPGWISPRIWLRHWQMQRYGRENAGLVQALTLGKGDAITSEQWDQLRHSGTVHLAVISGLHIGFIAVAVFWLALKIPARFGWHAGRALAVWLSIAFSGAYMLLAGTGLPVLRAFIMVSVFMLAELRLWRLSAWQRWCLALLLVQALMPLSIFSPGFWLSFTAVAVLIWLAGLKRENYVGLAPQWAIFVGMSPLLAFLFSGVSVVAPLINLVAIPYIALLLTLIVVDHLLALLSFDLLQPLVEMMVELFWWGQAQLSAFEYAYRPVADVSFLALLLALVGSWIWLQPLGFPGRWLAVLLWLPWLFGELSWQQPAQFRAWIFDVGQGSAVLVEVGDYRLLYDTGPGYLSGGAAAERAIWPYLEQQAVPGLALLVLSHDDIDHTGGAEEIIGHLNPGRILTGGEQFLGYAQAERCRAGQAWQVGKVRFEMLAGSRGREDNDRSCVLKVSNSQCSLLLPGDIGFHGESVINSNALPLTWLLAAHHGSKNSTSIELLRSWQPRHVIFSAGYGNHFGHPASEVLQRVRQQGAVSWGTSGQGAIRLLAFSDRCETAAQRELRPRFWAPSVAPGGLIAGGESR